MPTPVCATSRARCPTGSSTSSRRVVVRIHFRPPPCRVHPRSATCATSCSSAAVPKDRGFGAGDQNRERIAQVAARLILEHGITDWTHAKRKAARQLMLPEREALPGDDEVEAALAEHQEIFGGDEHVASLRAQREEALVWMRRLAEFRPMLVGGVASGWAGEHNDIRLDLVADDQKAVELVLINHDVPYRVGPMRSADAPSVLLIETDRGGVRL